jgi:DNA recombination protein RmuC
MTLTGLMISLLLAVAAAIASALIARQRGLTFDVFEERLASAERRLREDQDRIRRSLEAAIREAARVSQQQNVELAGRLETRVERHLSAIRAESSAHLEKIRATVDEKLHATLEHRLGDSFRLVSERLEQLHRGLGEMQTLAHGVGDLKKVLTNVRARGTFGEIQLASLLEQVLAPDQYAANVATVPGRSERVEFAIKLPGRDDRIGTVFLPIDAKFPIEDYQRLQQAYEDSDVAAAEAARRALRTRLLEEARAIRDKYVSPPHTTDFAILFVPFEGLYAEILRIPGLNEALQVQARIVIVGPTTLFAVLSSLQMGFRTLAIEKRSSEVWNILAGVKTEFAKFGATLDAVSKKLEEAGHKIADATQRTRVMERKLRAVEALPEEIEGP